MNAWQDALKTKGEKSAALTLGRDLTQSEKVAIRAAVEALVASMVLVPVPSMSDIPPHFYDLRSE